LQPLGPVIARWSGAGRRPLAALAGRSLPAFARPLAAATA